MTVFEVAVLRTGVANTAAVAAALERAGARAVAAERAPDVRAAAALVVPGVGAFGAGLESLARNGLDAPVRERLAAGRPTLAVCLGMQLLSRGSAESPGVPGIGALAARFTRFADAVRVPHVGWNRVDAPAGARILASGDAYFAHSFRTLDEPPGWIVARAEHGGPFVAALERGPIVLCQFHPELSGRFGAELLERWIAAAQQEAGAC